MTEFRFSYIFDGQHYTDVSAHFMQSLGMSDEVVQSVLEQYDYELKKHRQSLKRKRDQRLSSESCSVVSGVGLLAVSTVDHLLSLKETVEDGIGENWKMADGTWHQLSSAQLSAAYDEIKAVRRAIWDDYRKQDQALTGAPALSAATGLSLP